MILLELVPHDLETLPSQAQHYLDTFPQLSGINVPDIKRIDTRSIDAARALVDKQITVVPHIRTMDHSQDYYIEALTDLHHKGLKQVLLVSGDPVKNPNIHTYDTTPISLTKALKKAVPNLTVYCGCDPYRQTFQKEMTYAQEKIDAGADGLFFQPFFSAEHAALYCDYLSHTQLFIGISPVTSQASYNYWINVNQVAFPKDFQCTLEHNIKTSKRIIEVTQKHKQNLYLMPIKTPVMDYLKGIFET